MAYEVRVIVDPAELDALREPWERLSAAGAGDALFGSWLWNRTWWNHYRHRGELYLLAATRGDELAGLWPLFREKRSFADIETEMIGPVRMVLPGKPFALRALCYLGSGEICSDFLAPLLLPGEEEPLVEALLSFLRARKDWDLLDLIDMDAASPAVIALEKLLPQFLGKMRRRFRYRAPYAELPGTYDDYLNTLSKKGRFNARKKPRQLSLNHKVEHGYHADPATLDAAMDSFIGLHTQRWQAEGLPGVFVNEHFVGFHREMAAAGLARDWLRLGFLKVDDETLFSTYAYHVDGRCYLYQQGGMTDWHHYNLGYVALGFSIDDACTRGCRLYDFLRGDAEYKLHWAKQERELMQLQAVRPGLRGKWFMWHSTINTDNEVRNRIKRLIRKS